MRNANRSNIEEQLSALIDVIEDKNIFVSINPVLLKQMFDRHQGQRHDIENEMPIRTKVSIEDLVTAFTMGGKCNLVDYRDYMFVYETLHQYLKLWSARIARFPDFDFPSIEDFVNMDDYLQSIHADYSIQKHIAKQTNVSLYVPETYRRKMFSGHKIESILSPTGMVAEKYVSLIPTFHDVVWKRRDQ